MRTYSITFLNVVKTFNSQILINNYTQFRFSAALGVLLKYNTLLFELINEKKGNYKKNSS